MDIARARYLLSEAGQAALAAHGGADASDPVKLATALRRSLPSEEASAAGEQLTLRARAVRNHGRSDGWLYTAHGLEMMTHPMVAERRAARLSPLGLPVADLTCGLGGDLAAVRSAGGEAVGMDRDPVHAMFAAHNAGAPTVRGDASAPPLDVGRFAVIIDPSRREGGARRFSPGSFSPPWDAVLRIAGEARAAVIKAPPGIGAEFVPTGAELEAVQLGPSMREVSLWTGAGAAPGLRRSVLLPSGATLESTEPEADATPVEPRGFLFDPESCVTRATLVTHLAHRLGARLLDPHIAYLTASSPAFSPLAATFEVLDQLPFSVARLKQRLREAHWRPDEIRRRAFPVEPDELRRLLGKLDGEPVTLLLTTLADQRTAFITRRLFAPA